MTQKTILTINAGSSSLKVCLFTPNGERKDFRYTNIKNMEDTFEQLVEDLGDIKPDVVSHRVVHGGDIQDSARVVDINELTRLIELIHLAPLHLPANLMGITICNEIFNCPQVACYDTSFHSTIPELSHRLPIPTELGFRKYGFHGLNYAHIARELPKHVGTWIAKEKVIVAHLGSGSSLCAMVDLKSVDTSMGYTPAGGVVMGTRPGDIDPGILIELSKTHSPEEVENIIFNKSGLLALSNGESNDMQELLASDTEDAKFAVEYFCNSVVGNIGSMAAKLGGVDVLIFTGGIGQHSSTIRQIISDKLKFLKIKIAVVIPADEELTLYNLASELCH